MQLYTFTWTPGNDWNSGPKTYEELKEHLSKFGWCETWWSAESHRRYPTKTGRNDLAVGDKFILCKSGVSKKQAGIIGFGEISRTFYVDEHYQDPSEKMYRVMLKFKMLDKDTPLLSSSELSSLVGEIWNPLNKNNINKCFSNETTEHIWKLIDK